MGDDVNVTSVNNSTDWETKLTAHRAPSIEAVRRANGGRGDWAVHAVRVTEIKVT
jgi:hypothetical protein